MNPSGVDSSQLEAAEDAAVGALRWSYRLSVQQLSILLLAVVLGSSLAWLSGSLIPLYWVAYFVALGLGGALLVRAYREDPSLAAGVQRWQRLAIAFAAASGVGWGAAALFLFDLAAPQGAIAVTALTVAVTFAGALLWASSLPAQLAFVVPAALPLLIRLALTGSIGLIGAATVLVVLGVIVASTSLRNGLLPEILKLKGEFGKSRRDLIETREDLVQAFAARDQMKTERDSIKSDLGSLRRQAEEASLAKDEFLATMSHEIRTPLNGILPILDLLRGTSLDDEQRGHMHTIFASSRHLLSIIDDMLDYSKIQAGKLELESVGINLGQVVESVTKLLSGSAKRKGLELETRIDPGVRLSMRGDPVRLRQIITNLVGNAIKFTERGKVEVSISNKSETPTEYELLFTIRDTGIGMDEAAQRKLFEPFSQADASTTRNFGGSGLGLVICKRLVTLMGGEIGVRSKPGQGSEFWFSGWLKKAIGDIDPEARRLAGVRMLMVTSDQALAQQARLFAHKSGCNLELVTGLQKAVAQIKKSHRENGRWKLDLVALDVASVGGQSIALAKKILSHPKLDLPCLLLNKGGTMPAALDGEPSVIAMPREVFDRSLCDAIAGMLPAKNETVSVNQDPSVPAEYREEKPISARVLLVEDNHINLHVAKKLMDSLGIEYVLAENGKDAIEALEHQTFDAVLMDCMMPVMDGYTASSKWRAHENQNGLKRVPIVAMTANAMAGDRQKCLDAGMDAYMSKPLDRHLVAETLRRLIAGAPPGLSLAAPVKQAAVAGGDLDESVLQALSHLMGDELHELIRAYIVESPNTIEKIVRAARWGHQRQVAALAHELKSTSVSLGAVGVAQLAQTIEIAAKAAEIERVSANSKALPAAFDRAVAALRKFTAAAAA